MALILSLNESLFQAVPGVGILLGGLIAEFAGPRAALAVAAAGSAVVACLMWLRLAAIGDSPATTPRPVDVADPETRLTAVVRQP